MENYKIDGKTKELIEAFMSLKDPKEMGVFLRDLCTLDELKEMSERWSIVKLLNRKVPYREIAEKLKVSTTTVSRVAYWLNYGMGGYKIALENNHHHSSHSRKS